MNNNDANLTRRHMTTLFEFARAMRTSIQNINENSYNNFITRIGKIQMIILNEFEARIWKIQSIKWIYFFMLQVLISGQLWLVLLERANRNMTFGATRWMWVDCESSKIQVHNDICLHLFDTGCITHGLDKSSGRITVHTRSGRQFAGISFSISVRNQFFCQIQN